MKTISSVKRIPKRSQLFVIALLSCLFCGSFAWGKGGPHPPQRPGGYQIDSEHSSIQFKAHHHEAGYTWGRFIRFNGDFETGENGDLLSIQATARSRSIDTDNFLRDVHLRSSHYLSVLRFPTIRFSGESIEPLPDGRWKVTGPLELHGVTLPLTVLLRKTGEGIGPFGKERFGLETEFAISLADYGIVREGIGDELRLYVNLEGVRRKAH